MSREEKDKIKEYQRKKYQVSVHYKKDVLKNNLFFFLSEKTLKFNNIRLNKKECHKSKEPNDLWSVNVD